MHRLPCPFPIRINVNLRQETIIGSLILTLAVGMAGYGMVQAADATCTGNPITVPNAKKDLLDQNSPSRPGNCITPNVIFMHLTNDPNNNAVGVRNYFNTGGGGENTNAQFIIDKDGTIIQTVEAYSTKIEYARTNDPYNNQSIGIEMVAPQLTYNSKSDMPAAQYQAALALVQFLMKQYNIPLGTQGYDWSACNSAIQPGVHGHYQVCGTSHLDPGSGWLKDFLADLGNGTGASVTSGAGAAGRWVPYDAYARPYSWPVSGTILQNYGFTDEAQNLGMRYPTLYPKGDPGVIYSTTNHTTPPPNALVDKYINPNIDIAPRSNDTLGRAVYSTQAGWITFADWAGPEKGYTIQIESDVNGDGQADLATRYMRLQAPTVSKDGAFFAPDIPVIPAASTAQADNTTTGDCTDPASADWAPVNKWDSQVQQGIAAAQKTDNVAAPCNLVKAFMKLESGGVELAPNSDGYMGLMQVGDGSATGGGSNCDWHTYDIHTTQGNVNCGVQEIARGYKSCNNNWDGAILKYFTGSCTGGNGGADAFGTTPQQYLDTVKKNWDYLNSQQAKTPAPNVPPPSSTASAPPTSTQLAPSLPPPTILQAEDMEHDSTANVITDPQAGGGKAMELLSNGSLNKAVTDKADQITVRAKGDQCGGAPTMVLKIDGTEFKRFDVTSTDWADYTTTAYFNGANHQYSIEFINDFRVLSGLICDRNLYVDYTKFAVTDPNTVTAKTNSEQLIEAENLKTRTTTGKTLPAVMDDPQASGGKYVHMVDNSSISDKVSIPTGNWIIVRARGTACQGYPHVVVKLDGTTALETDVTNQDWAEYSTALNLSGGSSASTTTATPPSSTSSTGTSSTPPTSTSASTTHDVSVEFTNDKYVSPWCDRNLDVDVIKIQDNTVNQTTNNANSLIGKTKYVGFNQLIGYVSDGRDHEKKGVDLSQVPNANQTYLSYRIMYNNPNFTTFPLPNETDQFINAKVDNPYIVETADNTVAGSLKVAFDHLNDPMWFFCALRVKGNLVKCIDAPNPY